MGFEEATPIQAETIPLAMKGEDVIGQAQTGTGKTAAFGIPMLEKFNRNEKGTKGLVVAPTCELAIQVAAEIDRLGRNKGIKTLAIYGGHQMGRQIRALKDGPHIVVATPGRLLDHMPRRTLNMSDIQVAALSEGDEMVHVGFIDDADDILNAVPAESQPSSFSAPVP